MSQQEMPIFTRTFDFLTVLLPMTNHFPTTQRHMATRRLLDAAFDLRERLETANLRRGTARRQQLELADEALARVRLYVRLARRWQWLSVGQYQHLSEMLVEIGRRNCSGLFKLHRKKNVIPLKAGVHVCAEDGYPLTRVSIKN